VCIIQVTRASSPQTGNWTLEDTEVSPAVRRMQALVGQKAPFDHGREQIKLVAGLEVT
jgi:hypothetical protein